MIFLTILYILIVLGMLGQGILFLFGQRWVRQLGEVIGAKPGGISLFQRTGAWKLRVLGIVNILVAAGIISLFAGAGAMEKLPIHILLMPVLVYGILIIITIGWAVRTKT